MDYILTENGKYISCFVYKNNVKVGVFTMRAYYKKRKLILDQIDVLKKHRNQGIGSDMLEYIKKWACDHKIKKITGDVMQSVDTDKLIRWYEKNGFKVENNKLQFTVIPYKKSACDK